MLSHIVSPHSDEQRRGSMAFWAPFKFALNFPVHFEQEYETGQTHWAEIQTSDVWFMTHSLFIEHSPGLA